MRRKLHPDILASVAVELIILNNNAEIIRISVCILIYNDNVIFISAMNVTNNCRLS